MTVAEILDSPAMPDLPFASPVPQIPVHAIVQVDTTDGVRYTQACGHRTWWGGPIERTPRVGQLHGCIACWAELLGAESLAHAVPVAMPTHAEPVTPPDLLANFNAFRKWLTAKAPTDDVGEAQTSGYCPIATYLRDSGVDEPQVGPDVVGWNVDPSGPFDEAAPRAPLPKWAQKFVGLVDGQGACHPIRASLAMTLLYEAVRESIGDDR